LLERWPAKNNTNESLPAEKKAWLPLGKALGITGHPHKCTPTQIHTHI